LDAEAGSRFTPSKKILWDPIRQQPNDLLATPGWDTALVPVRDFRTVQKAFEWLNSGQHPFRSVVMDSISEVQQRAVDDIAGTNQMQTQDWGQLLRIVSDLVRKFRDLVANPIKPLDAVVFIAMTRQVNEVWRPYVQGQLSTTLPYYVDIVGYLAPIVTPETGELTRRLFTGTFPGYETGERVGGCLGPFTDSPDVSRMLATIRARTDAGIITADAGVITAQPQPLLS
jgi:hypothetical protein